MLQQSKFHRTTRVDLASSACESNMQIAVASSSSVGIPILKELLAGSHTIAYVITNPDKSTGRGQRILPNDFAAYAEMNDLQIEKPESKAELTSLVTSSPIDLVVTVAYGRIVPLQALDLPRYGWLNVHFSKLPRWRGASPVQYALLNQDKLAAISIFQLDEGMDTGPIYLAEEFPIQKDETTSQLLERCAIKASTLLGKVLKSIEDGEIPSPQIEAGVTYAPKFSKSDGHIKPSQAAQEILAKVRALSENPGVYILFRGERLSINRATISEYSNAPQTVGALVATKHSLFLRVCDGVIELNTVTPQGKKQMSGADFARGARIEIGELIE